MVNKKQLSEVMAHLGAIGGRSRSPAKLAAIAQNAKKAGRPRKKKSKRK